MIGGRAATETVIKGRFAISVNDPGHDVPAGWIRTPLADLAELGTGHTPSRNEPAYWDGDIPWIGIRDARAHHGKVVFETAQHISAAGLANSSARLLPKDTICLSRTASVGYLVKMGRSMTTSQDFITWSCGEGLDPDFLLQALLAEGDHIRAFGRGSTHTTIYFPELKALQIDLPPLAEQRRIVAKLKAVTADLGRARAELRTGLGLSKRLRLAEFTAVFNSPEAGDLVRLDTVCRVGTGATPKKGNPRYYDRGTVAWVTSTVVNKKLVTAHSELITNAAIRETNCRPYPVGSLLIAMYGEGQTRGRVSTLGIEAATNQALAVLHDFDMDKIDPSWLRLFLESRYEVTRSAAAGGVQPNLNLGIIKAIEIPLPPLEVQRNAVGRLEAAFARADRLEAETAKALALIDRLEAAVLAKAFRGELVAQDPADEPASVLLERIQAGRAADGLAHRGRRPKAMA